MLVQLSHATPALATGVDSCISSWLSFSGLLYTVLDATGTMAPGFLPLASSAVKEDAATSMPLLAALLALKAMTQAPSRLIADLLRCPTGSSKRSLSW